MIIDTRKKVIAIQLRRMITLIVFAILLTTILIVGKMPNTFLGLNKNNWALVVVVILIASIVLENTLQLNYIYFNDEKEKIIFRFFSLGYFNRSKQSIEIPKKEFLKCETHEYLKGYKKTITFHQVRNQKEAKYPPVSVSILSKTEFSNLVNRLGSYKEK